MGQYVDSITLRHLAEVVEKALKQHPEWESKQVYFDALHINGHITEVEGSNCLELN